MEEYEIGKRQRLLPAVLITVALTATVTFLLCQLLMRRTKLPYEGKLREIQACVDRYFIGNADAKAISDGAASGMIQGLGDEWSYYIPKEEYQAYLDDIDNSYVGIGVTISTGDTDIGISVTDVTPGSPAEQAGIRPGDALVAVDGIRILDGSEGALDLEAAKNRIRGEAGTSIILTVLRDGHEQDLSITRARIQSVNISSEVLDEGLYYIRIRNFDKRCAEETISVLKQAQAAGAKGVIFDVRNNPGGLKDELIALLDYILPEGPLFRSVDYTGKEQVDHSDPSHIEIPMAVLVNYNSYSAAEFFAAALQEYDYAEIVGARTYGKGYFQSSIELSDGSAINLSIGKYTTPNGVSLVGKGVTPDKEVALDDQKNTDLYYGRLDPAEDDQLQAAIQILDPGATGTLSDRPDTDAKSEESSNPESHAYQAKLRELQAVVDHYYIGEVDEESLSEAIAAAFMKNLGDEWSYYIPADLYSEYIESIENEYVGIGVTITDQDVERGVRITEVVPFSPAERAGLQADDLILAVEGIPILDGSEDTIDMDEAKNRVRGEKGTAVTLTVSHEGSERDVKIIRDSIHVRIVTSQALDSGLYYIRIRNFDQGAAGDTIAAIEAAQRAGAKGIVFDLRYNPGGLKSELVELLDYILPEGPLFRSTSYTGRESVDSSDPDHIEIPMAVLVNYNSYSAAEFFAAALQEYDYAEIVGEQTYGKGRFQISIPLSDGSAVNLSVGTYTTPNGESLVGKGITPNYVVTLDEADEKALSGGKLNFEDDEQLETAISILTNTNSE